MNNYENFLVWVNAREDQLKLVSVAQGQDIKYVLLRLQRAVTKVEEAVKSCQEKGFTADQRGFAHNQVVTALSSANQRYLCCIELTHLLTRSQ